MHRSERRALFLPSYLLLFVDPLGAQSSNELEIGTAAAREGAVATIPLRLKLPGPAKRGTMGATDEVQGLVMVFEWDGKVGTGVGLTAGAALLGADMLVTRVEAFSDRATGSSTPPASMRATVTTMEGSTLPIPCAS